MVDRWTADETARILREPTATDDKYSRGVVGIRTGSDRFPGAAVLGVEAAWRTGVGMVRYLGPRRAGDLVLARRPETVCAQGRVQAWVVGSGTDAADRASDEHEALAGILRGDAPVVLDAGALDLAGEGDALRILTPHDREHDRVRAALALAPVGEETTAARIAAAEETAAALGAVVLLKGAQTLVAAPGVTTRVVEVETARLATAGSGDVLAGIVGGVLAGAPGGDLSALAAAAAAGTWLHSRAAAAAVAAHGGGPITALDVAEAVPAVIGALLAAAR